MPSLTAPASPLMLRMHSTAAAYPMYDVTKPWVEGTQNGVQDTSGANWTNYNQTGPFPWGSTGGGASQTGTGSIDRDTLNLWSATASSFTPTGVKTVSLTADGLTVVRRWLAGGVNNGVIIQQTTSGASDTLAFDSSEGATPPVLNVTYCLPASTTTYDLDISVDPGAGGTTNPAAGTHSYTENTVVNITATPATGYVFDYWSGACTGSGACSVTMSAAKSVVAHFALAYNLTTAVLTDRIGQTGGTTSPAVGDHWYKAGTVVPVTATANPGFHFAVWSGGGCTGTDPNVCNVTMDANKTVEANFAIDLVALSVTFPGTGSGTVTSAPTGISCSSAPCSYSFDYNSSVTLTAAPTLPGSVFTGWGGDCTGLTCSLTMTATRNVTATFTSDTTLPRLPLIKMQHRLILRALHRSTSRLSSTKR